MQRAAIGFVLLVGGCHHGGNNAASDMAIADLSAPSADLTGQADFSTCIASGMSHAKFVINAMSLPTQHSDFAIDLNGDTALDDQLGDIIGALATQGIMLQEILDQAIAAGNDVTLLDVAATDAQFANDLCAATTFYAGVNQPSPDFTGAGHFTVDTSSPSTMFSGALQSTLFSSAPAPRVQSPPLTLRLAFPPFGTTPLTLVGAQIEWGYISGVLESGQIHGAITQHDVQYVVVPGLAATLNQQIQSDPTSTQTMQIRATFDTGGAPDPKFGSCANNTCKGEDGACGVANDGVIQVCELATNAIMAAVLAPDVQMFDNGTYAPSLANAMKDSVSVGLGFAAVGASF
ncbi:MAG TPA: hypothetical protein VHB97_24975 [Polyangia bacterium]|jgi:hypothetical protein|nr:hypothetical protein [Polyangia bacterium]